MAKGDFYLDILKDKNIDKKLKKELAAKLTETTHKILLSSLIKLKDKVKAIDELHDGEEWLHELIRLIISSYDAYQDMKKFVEKTQGGYKFFKDFEHGTMVSIEKIGNDNININRLKTEITLTTGNAAVASDLFRLLAISFMGGEWKKPGYFDPTKTGKYSQGDMLILDAKPGFNEALVEKVSQEFQKILLEDDFFAKKYEDSLAASSLKDVLTAAVAKNKIGGK